MSQLRPDLAVIARHVAPGSRVLDVGCGDGQLMAVLRDEKQVDARGMEIDPEEVEKCVARGLSAVQGDANRDLADYPDDAFDYAVLSQTLQATRDPRRVLQELVRIGRRAIVSFPNFGCWKVRLHIGRHGRMPVTAALPEKWYNTPNIHLCTILDFVELCQEVGVYIERGIAFSAGGKSWPIHSKRIANLMGEQGLFLLRRR
jgi:methionine biosynthesis protein MetW